MDPRRISSDFPHLIDAAKALHSLLVLINEPHCFVGGFVLNLLGSKRQTYDIDLMVTSQDVVAVRLKAIGMSEGKLFEVERRLYYRLHEHGKVVLIEMLHPQAFRSKPFEDLAKFDIDGLPCLHPTHILPTKLNRWAFSEESSRPQTVGKARKEWADVEFLMKWLREEGYEVGVDQVMEWSVFPREKVQGLMQLMRDKQERSGARG